MLLVLAITLGPSIQGAGMTGAQGQTMSASMGKSATPGDCQDSNDCGEATEQCVMPCTGPVALAADPAGAPPPPAVAPVLDSVKTSAGRLSAPEPYPPRSAIRS